MPDPCDLKALVRTLPDYPKPGILFRDITTLLLDVQGFRATIDALAAPFLDNRAPDIDKVAGIEARGFILGGAVADRLGCGFIPVRKGGKLPAQTIGEDYLLEYGSDRVEIHVDAVVENERVLLLDDLIATGGTALAAIRLLERAGARVDDVAAVIDLPDLGGADRLREAGKRVHAVMTFDGD